MNKKQAKEREVAATSALLDKLKLPYKVWPFNPIIYGDGSVFYKKQICYFANVRQCHHSKYPSYLVEKYNIESMMAYTMKGYGVWLIQHFFNEKPEHFDSYVFDMSPKIEGWIKNNHVPYIFQNGMPVTTASMTDVRTGKEYIKIYPKEGKLYENIYVKNYNL